MKLKQKKHNMFSLIDLPYAYDALEPVISARTLEFHHGKHLQAYVDNLNKLLPGTPLESLSLEEIVVKVSGSSTHHAGLSSNPHAGLDPASRAIFNNAGQVLNHNLYFTQFSPNPHAGQSLPHAGLDPASPLAQQIAKQWGSIDSFKTDFESKGVGLFGSGWVWLQANAEGELSIGQYSNADNPVAHGLKPILTFDVWEHAYYLDYQNRRAAHLSALWQIINWSEITRRYV